VILINHKQNNKKPSRNQILAVLVVLAALLVALALRLEGAELATVLVAVVGVALALAKRR
jgi:hypothetical protein